jgi:DNA-binding transcriptional regulator YiaG
LRQGTTVFKHKRLSPAEVSAGLAEFGLTIRDYARLTGVGFNTVQKWLDGVDEPPHQVALNFALWRLPGALEKAWQESESRLL